MPDVYATARQGWRTRLASPLAARARAKRHESFFHLARITRESRIVDLGSGPLGLRAFAPELDVTGVDRLPKPEYPGPFVQADVTARLPFDDGEFDLAYSSSLIEHLAPAERAAFAAEVRRVGARMVRPDPCLLLPDRAARPAAVRSLASAASPARLLAAGRGRRLGGRRPSAPPGDGGAVRRARPRRARARPGQELDQRAPRRLRRRSQSISHAGRPARRARAGGRPRPRSGRACRRWR